jgi:antitoxin (DNA-binding transcriptional repressor) of toxin-antitoxin stability system
MRERLAKVLDRVQSGEEVIVMRRGKPAARIVKPAAQPSPFRSRQALRDAIPPMERSSQEEVRDLRNGERF